MEPIEIYEFGYYMQMGCGAKNDVWRYQGNAPNHPTYSGLVCPSSPVEFNENELILKTISGKYYKIESFSGDRQKIIDQIKSDIAGGGFERH
jgi:hypothetical protein